MAMKRGPAIERFYTEDDRKQREIIKGTTRFETVVRDASIKQVVGEAIGEVAGVLGVKGKLYDVFKADGDLTRGIAVQQGKGEIKISAQLIIEEGWDASRVISEVTDTIAYALEMQLSVRPTLIEISVVGEMTRQAFYDRYGSARAIH